MSMYTEMHHFCMLNDDGYTVTVKPVAFTLGISSRDSNSNVTLHECVACFKCDDDNSDLYKIQFGMLKSHPDWDDTFEPEATLYAKDKHAAIDIMEYMNCMYLRAEALISQ